MKILVVSASFIEIKEILDRLHLKMHKGSVDQYRYGNHSVDFIITGLGIVSTTYVLQKTISNNRYDLVVHAGIAGACSHTIKKGDVVEIIEDRFADLGVFRDGEFLSVFEAGMLDKDEKPYRMGKLVNNNKVPFDMPRELKKVKGITVNHPSADRNEALAMYQKYHADVETMESAALFYVCLMEDQPFLSLRSISNIAGEDRTTWDIPLAVSVLTDVFTDILTAIKQ